MSLVMRSSMQEIGGVRVDSVRSCSTLRPGLRGNFGRLAAAVAAPSAPTGSSFPLRRVGRWLAVLLILVALAQATRAQTPTLQPPADEEPITPVPLPPAADPQKLALGERLFADPRLSRDGSRTCSTCHDTGTNGGDRTRHETAVNGSNATLNTRTVFNVALSFRLGWEGRFRTLDAQAEASLENPEAMGTTVAEVVGKMSADPAMTRQFSEAYGHGPDRASLLDAIATYERSLLTPGSRFDRWLSGDAAALSAEEQNGYQLFKSLGCVSCQQGVNVGGNLLERHGIFTRSPRRNPSSCACRACATWRQRHPTSTTAAPGRSTKRCARWVPLSSTGYCRSSTSTRSSRF